MNRPTPQSSKNKATKPDSSEQPSAGQLALIELLQTKGCFHEICRDKLYLVYLNEPENRKNFCKDLRSQTPGKATCPFRLWPFDFTTHIAYEAFNCDFGPLNLSATHMFCSKLKVWVDTIEYHETHKYIAIVLGSTCMKTNINVTVATAIAAMVLYGLNAQQVIASLSTTLGQSKKNYSLDRRFADVTGSQLGVTLDHVVWAFYMALQLDFYNYYKFDQIHYLYYETVVSGDLNWIVPAKILAFAGPSDKMNNSSNYYRHVPSFYHKYFRDNNVTTIIRLNEPEYERKDFTDHGFEHFDLIFPDGLAPTKVIAEEFIRIVDQAKGAVAVHCYAGIGRTGTLIAAYLMTKYGFTAQRAIAWTRICRPGSVIGEQEVWLCQFFDKRTMTRIRSRIDNFKKHDTSLTTSNKNAPQQANCGSQLLESELNSQGDDIDCECDEKVDVVDTATSCSQATTTYELAAKALGQAEALVMTKRQRKGAERKTKPGKMIADAEAAAATPSKSPLSKAIMPTSKPASPNSTINSTSQIILDLGTTIPFNFYIEDLFNAETTDNPDTYRMHDHGFQWTVKFPKSKHVAFKYDKAINESLKLAKNLPDIVVKEPILDCCLTSSRLDVKPDMGPVIYFSSDVV